MKHWEKRKKQKIINNSAKGKNNNALCHAGVQDPEVVY